MINEPGYFRPMDNQGRINKPTVKEILGYVNTHPNINGDILAAKRPGYPESYLVGLRQPIIAMLSALALLESLGEAETHMINVIFIADQINGKKTVNETHLPGIKNIASKLKLDMGEQARTGILHMDTHHPLFLATHDQLWLDYDPFCTVILYAGKMVHELTHVHQKRDSLPVNSLWAERSAITKQCKLYLQILNSGKLTRRQERGIIVLLKGLSQRIYDYRNGRNFNDHLILPGSNCDGTPTKNQDLHQEDFAFGY